MGGKCSCNGGMGLKCISTCTTKKHCMGPALEKKLSIQNGRNYCYVWMDFRRLVSGSKALTSKS
jgi:hypothetical protein